MNIDTDSVPGKLIVHGPEKALGIRQDVTLSPDQARTLATRLDDCGDHADADELRAAADLAESRTPPMTYNGRAVMATVAETHGWTIIPGAQMHGGTRAVGNELVAYERFGTQVLIEWTPQHAAVFIVKNYATPFEVRAQGPTGLITARSWLEEKA